MAHPLQTRLGKLTPSLGAKERFLLLLKAHNAGEPVDPAIRSSMPRSQVKAYNRYAQLVIIANHTLWPVHMALAGYVELLERQRQRLSVIEDAAAELEERFPEEAAREREAGVVSVPEYLRWLWGMLRADLRKDVAFRWRELRALETVWAEVEAEFDGESARDRQVRDLALDTKEKLDALAAALWPEGGTKRLPGPKPEFVDGLREVVRETYSKLGWLAPEDEEASQQQTKGNGRGR